jgi:hypothetical protein
MSTAPSSQSLSGTQQTASTRVMNLPGGANAESTSDGPRTAPNTAARQGPVLGLKLSKSGMTWRTS